MSSTAEGRGGRGAAGLQGDPAVRRGRRPRSAAMPRGRALSKRLGIAAGRLAKALRDPLDPLHGLAAALAALAGALTAYLILRLLR